MANSIRKIELNQKTNSGYTTLCPASEAHLISYDKTVKNRLTSTNLYDALVELYGLVGQHTTSYQHSLVNKPSIQIERKVNGSYVPIRVRTTAKQVLCYSPLTGQLSNMQDVIDDIIDNYLN